MHHKNTAYTEKTTTTSESISRILSGKHTFNDIENIYLKLMKRFILEPTKQKYSEWYKFQLKYVPFKKQQLSPEFIKVTNQLLDMLIANKKYQLFSAVRIGFYNFLTTVIDLDTSIDLLEKSINFFKSHPTNQYDLDIQLCKSSLDSQKTSKKLEKMEENLANNTPNTKGDPKTKQALENISDMLLDLNSAFKQNFLMGLDQEGVRDIVTDTN